MRKPSKSEDYVISFNTFVLQPVRKDNTIHTYVIERDDAFEIPSKPIHTVQKSTKYYGTSLHLLTNTAKLILGQIHKTPILLTQAYDTPFVFIPTQSPRSDQNTWIAYHAIDYIEPTELGCIVYLENNKHLELNISATSMFRQCSLARFLEKDFVKKQFILNKSYRFKPD